MENETLQAALQKQRVGMPVIPRVQKCLRTTVSPFSQHLPLLSCLQATLQSCPALLCATPPPILGSENVITDLRRNEAATQGAKKKQRELARKGSLKNGNMGSPVNQQPKKNNVMARTRLVVPNKGYSSLDQSPDEKPLVALDTDSDDDFDMSRYSSSGYSSAEQINQDLNIQLLKDGYRLDEIPDDEDLDLIPPKSVNPTCMCCQATSSTACHIQ
ncbi:protein FAM219A isoform X1 [Chrysemys picta bellii]|uniref:protein FAM219A isoform X1 n=1 Tax=Chrysemys picta bellii TaxID=8478 RepID=UPI0032B1FA34